MLGGGGGRKFKEDNIALHMEKKKFCKRKEIVYTSHELEKEMTTHSSILAWRIPCTEECGGLLSMGSQESDMT